MQPQGYVKCPGLSHRSNCYAGSRVHIYSFTKNAGELDLDEDTFEQLKPGLSAYADSPQKAAESLEPLMQKALDTVPDELRVSHSLYCTWYKLLMQSD